MKLQKFAKQVIRSNDVTLYIVRKTGATFLSLPYAVYPVEQFPLIDDAEQLATILDIPRSKWEKVMAKIVCIENEMVAGIDLTDNTTTEQMATRKTFTLRQGTIVTEEGEKRITFFNPEFLEPIQDRLKDPDAQITYWRREMENGTPYIVVKDGLFLIAAILPLDVVDQEYLKALAEYQSLCISEFERQKQGRTEEIIGG